jgi:hypothetical protein
MAPFNTCAVIRFFGYLREIDRGAVGDLSKNFAADRKNFFAAENCCVMMRFV